MKVVSEAKSSLEVFEVSPDFLFIMGTWGRAEGKAFFSILPRCECDI